MLLKLVITALRASCRDVINGKVGKAAALPIFFRSVNPISNRGEGADYAHPLALSCLKNSIITPLSCQYPLINYLVFDTCWFDELTLCNNTDFFDSEKVLFSWLCFTDLLVSPDFDDTISSYISSVIWWDLSICFLISIHSRSQIKHL